MKIEDLERELQSVNGWLSRNEIRFLYETARAAKGEGVILEIGSWQGKSTICLGRGSGEGAKVPIYAVDPHQDSYVHEDIVGRGVSTFEIFKNNIKKAGVDGLVTPIVKKSEDGVKGWNTPILFLWIDGDHRYDEVKKDFDLWSPFVVEGGVVAFHDSNYDDVQRFLEKEVLPLSGYKDAHLVDSITAVTKSSHHTALDSAKSRYIVFMNHVENMLRAIPISGNARVRLKKAAKGIMNNLT